MARLAIANCFLGFLAVFIAACGGVFLSFDSTAAFLHDKDILSSWSYTLMASAHGHTNLFGLLHIAMGLTLPYSPLKHRVKVAQSVGLGLGTLAMSVLMMLRAYAGPASSFDGLGLSMGVCLSASLAALFLHCYGLAAKLWRP